MQLPWQIKFPYIFRQNVWKYRYLFAVVCVCVSAYPKNYNNKIIIILNMEQVFHLDDFGMRVIMKKVIYMLRCQVEIMNVPQYRLERLWFFRRIWIRAKSIFRRMEEIKSYIRCWHIIWFGIFGWMLNDSSILTSFASAIVRLIADSILRVIHVCFVISCNIR